jgi:hypothetical protein
MPRFPVRRSQGWEAIKGREFRSRRPLADHERQVLRAKPPEQPGIRMIL